MLPAPNIPAALPERREFEDWAARALAAARANGATAADVQISVGRALTVSVRHDAVESIQFQRDRELGLTVYFGQRSGSSSSTDFSASAVEAVAEAACAIARAAGEDPAAGLPDADRLATNFPDLDLCHPWELSPEAAIELGRECEGAAFAADSKVRESEGASVDTRHTRALLANSLGFIGWRETTDHSLGCAVIAGEGSGMQQGHWYSSARSAGDLEAAAAVGRRAGERAAARLGAHSLTTRRAPVIFAAEIARGLFGHLIGAISGSALYRRASFLLDRIDQPVFAPDVNIVQSPFLPRAPASTAFDHEGVATQDRVLVDAGVLRGYLLSSYSARKLKLASTGNAGGVFNLVVASTAGSLESLLKTMHEGLLVTEVMGQGVNPVTGDYSRGASGFWVRNGVIDHPVQEVTIAGRLQDMFTNIRGIGSDVDLRGGVRCGSVLIDAMTIAGMPDPAE